MISTCLMLMLLALHLAVGEDVQHFHCSHNCPSPTQCQVKDITDNHVPDADSYTNSPSPAPSSCSLEVAKIQEDGRRHKSAFLRTNFTIPRMRNGLQPTSFTFYASDNELNIITYSLVLPKNTRYQENEIRVTVDFCNIRITEEQYYTIDILPNPFRSDTTESQICFASLDLEMTDCCSSPLKETYPCSGKSCTGPAMEIWDAIIVEEAEPMPPMHRLPIKRNPYKILIIPAIICLVLLIIIGIAWLMSKRRQATPHRLVILVSTGDKDSKYRDTSNEIASEMRQSGKFDDVYFSGWRSSLDGDKDIEELRESLDNCTIVLLVSSPFGAQSYQDFLNRREMSTWKDLFVLGLYALYHNSTFPLRKQRRIMVAYMSDDDEAASSHLHRDFVPTGSNFYNLSKQPELDSLCSKLLGRRRNSIKSSSKMAYMRTGTCQTALV